MKSLSIPLLLVAALPSLAQQQYKIAVVGLVHSHVWGHLREMVKNEPAQLVGVAEPVQELVDEAKKPGVADNLIFSDYRKMLDEIKPDIVWAFVENNRHLEIVQACAPRKINVIFEKPLASTYKDAVTFAIWPQERHPGDDELPDGMVARQLRGTFSRRNRERRPGLPPARDCRTRRPWLRRRAQQIFLRMAHGSGEERRRRPDGFRMLQRAVEPVVSRAVPNRSSPR